MDQDLARFFFEEASNVFAFVVSECSFADPTLIVEQATDFAIVTFMGRNLAIDCILDARERHIDCKIVRVIDGKKSPYYAVDETGTRVREGLASLLRRKGVRERLFARVGQLELPEQIRATLGDFASMLKKHGREILDDLPTALADL